MTYLYSVFINDFDHFTSDAPRLIIKLRDQANNPDESLSKTITPDQKDLNFQDGQITDSIHNERWRYTSWHKVSLDLTAYINQYVSIEFNTTDCFPRTRTFQSNNGVLDTICSLGSGGKHSAYAYIDLYCSPVVTAINPIDIHKFTFELFPNPMNSELTIDVSGIENYAIAELKLYDYMGKEIRSQKLKNGTQKLYRENLSNGIYFVEISNGKTVIQKKKIVINN